MLFVKENRTPRFHAGLLVYFLRVAGRAKVASKAGRGEGAPAYPGVRGRFRSYVPSG